MISRFHRWHDRISRSMLFLLINTCLPYIACKIFVPRNMKKLIKFNFLIKNIYMVNLLLWSDIFICHLSSLVWSFKICHLTNEVKSRKQTFHYSCFITDMSQREQGGHLQDIRESWKHGRFGVLCRGHEGLPSDYHTLFAGRKLQKGSGSSFKTSKLLNFDLCRFQIMLFNLFILCSRLTLKCFISTRQYFSNCCQKK